MTPSPRTASPRTASPRTASPRTASPRTASPRTPSPRTARIAAGLAAALVTLTACTSAGNLPAASTSPTEPTTSPSPSATAPSPSSSLSSPSSSSVEIPTTDVGEQVSWLLGSLAPGAGPSLETVAERFAPGFLEVVPAPDLVLTLAQVGASGPWTATSYVGDATSAVVGVTDATGQALELQISLDSAGQIEGLLFAPAFEHTAATTWEELGDQVAALPAATTVVLIDVSDPAAPEVVFTQGDLAAHPVASSAKLYVLLAVVTAVAEGTLAWTDELEVTDALRSLPSGELQDAPAGTRVTVEEAATAMIEISDNTATDLLIEAVGREAVEAAVIAAGHSDPALLTPFPRTRDLFILGWTDPALRTAWAQGDAAARRDLLATLPTGAPAVDLATMTDAVWDDGIDWFATPSDLVAVHLALQALTTTPAGEPLAEILGANTAMTPEQAAAWDTVAFKGGSSLGVLALTWYLQGADGSYVLTIQARSSDPATTTDVRPWVAAAEDALTLLKPS